MTAVVYWFRSDLRLNDNPAFAQARLRANQTATKLLVVYVHDPKHSLETDWGFERMGAHRKTFLAERLHDLALQLKTHGCELLELQGSPKDALWDFVKLQNTAQIYCEDIAAPEEQADIDVLQAAGLDVKTLWQSSLLEPADLPFDVQNLPAVFTAFRSKVEKQDIKPRAVDDKAFNLSESTAQKHLKNYFAGDFALTYKLTRNQPMNWSPEQHFSTQFSPWLACGALSAPMIYAELKRFEAERGANDSTYWIWFELLWRDYFRFLHLQNGKKLYIKQGLGNIELAKVPDNRQGNNQGFRRWCAGQTGESLVDAGMRELAATGWLSNRMRQVVASYLIYDLGCDWRAGAAWFESQLIDYDVYSNQGNWLYIAGRGTDPRGGRRFNPQMQAQQHDADGAYRQLWSSN